MKRLIFNKVLLGKVQQKIRVKYIFINKIYKYKYIMPKGLYLGESISLPRSSLSRNLNTKRNLQKREEKTKKKYMKQKAFLKLLPVLAGLHNTVSPADRLLPNITLGKKGEFDQYDPSSPFSVKPLSKIKYVNKRSANEQKNTKKHIHRGGRKTRKSKCKKI